MNLGHLYITRPCGSLLPEPTFVVKAAREPGLPLPVLTTLPPHQALRRFSFLARCGPGQRERRFVANPGRNGIGVEVLPRHRLLTLCSYPRTRFLVSAYAVAS